MIDEAQEQGSSGHREGFADDAARPLVLMSAQLAQMHVDMRDAFTALARDREVAESRSQMELDAIHERFATVDQRMAAGERRIASSEARIERMVQDTDRRLAQVDQKLVTLYERTERWNRVTAGAGFLIFVAGLFSSDYPGVQAVLRAMALPLLGPGPTE